MSWLFLGSARVGKALTIKDTKQADGVRQPSDILKLHSGHSKVLEAVITSCRSLEHQV